MRFRKSIAFVMAFVLLILTTGQAAAGRVVPTDESTPGDVVAESPSSSETVSLSEGVHNITGTTILEVNGAVCGRIARILERNGRAYVPVRGFADCLGLETTWLEGDGRVLLTGQLSEKGPFTTLSLRARAQSPMITDLGGLTLDWQTDDDVQYNLGDDAPFIYDGTTFLPFRAITDVYNVFVTFIPGTPNRIMVSPSIAAIAPDDQKEKAWDYLHLKDQSFYVDDAIVGAPGIYPSAIHDVREFAENANWYKSLGKGIIGYSPIAHRLTVYDKYGQIDIYPTHYVRWMNTRDSAEAYAKAMANSRNEWIYAGIASMGAGWIKKNPQVIAKLLAPLLEASGLSGEAAVAAVSTAIADGSLFVAAGIMLLKYEDQQHAALLKPCLDKTLEQDQYRSRFAPAPRFYMGWAYGHEGITCLPHYSDSIIDADGRELN